jgi:Na+/melibiose symporter-like transporter
MVGFLTDGTRSASGRRRPWILASTLPVALTTFFMWNPPRSLEGDALFWWMFVTIALWETAMTALYVPYIALGSEITMEHHDRTRIAGYRYVLGGIGQASVIASVFLLTNAESSDARRDVAFWLVSAGATVSTLLIAGGILRVRERPEHRERGARRPSRALRDVLRNRHLLRLVVIYFFEISSVAAIGLLLPFICEYVIGPPARAHLAQARQEAHMDALDGDTGSRLPRDHGGGRGRRALADRLHGNRRAGLDGGPRTGHVDPGRHGGLRRSAVG